MDVVAAALRSLHLSEQLAIAFVTVVLSAIVYAGPRLPELIKHWRISRLYEKDHIAFYAKARKEGMDVLSMPWFSPPVHYVLSPQSITKAMGSNSIDPQVGADLFHFQAWDIPVYDPRWRDVIHAADKLVHTSLQKNKLGDLPALAEQYTLDELDHLRAGVGPAGAQVSLTTWLFRALYNSNARALFGPKMPIAETRGPIMRFEELVMDMGRAARIPGLPIRMGQKMFSRPREGLRHLRDTESHALKYLVDGSVDSASPHVHLWLEPFKAAGAPPEVAATWVNMIFFAFLSSTTQALGWVFTYLVQSPTLLKACQEEADALPEGSLADADLKALCPLINSAMFEANRLSVDMATGGLVKEDIVLPGIDKVFKKGEFIRGLGGAAAYDPSVYGDDVTKYRGARFAEKDGLFKYDTTFGAGKLPCPGRNYAQVALRMFVAHTLRNFDFSDFAIHHRLPEGRGDFELMGKVKSPATFDIIDYDGTELKCVHPGVENNSGSAPVLSALFKPKHEFVAKVTPRERA